MSENSKIEWTDHTFNPWEGCQKVGPGCDHCYAEARNARFGGGTPPNWGPGAARRRTSVANWRKPIEWNARPFFECVDCGWRGERPGDINGLPICPRPACASLCIVSARPRVFCASLADVFDNAVDPAWRADLFDLIARTQNLDWLLLTKRIGNVLPMLRELTPTGARQDDLSRALEKPEHWGHCVAADWVNGIPPKNVWLGATIVNQEEADRDILKLLAVPAAMRFLSMEPLLGPVGLNLLWNNDTARWDGSGRQLPLRRIDWVIVGGESGRAARPMSIQWARSLRDQCRAASVPFLFKQWGEWAPAGSYPSETPGQFAFGDYEHGPSRFIQTDHYPRQFTKLGARSVVERIGKRAAGRKLDGVTHDGFPRGVE